MAILDIVLYPNDILTTQCTPVDVVDDAIRTLIDDMAATMYDAPGIGLAAPQIGINKRIAVVDVGPRDEDDESGQLYVLVNPEIIEKSGEIIWEEGCLSIPGIYEKVRRANTIKVRALNREGTPYELEADELLAVAIQHEIDHLDGKLIFDHLSHLKRKMAQKKYRKLLQRMSDETDDASSSEDAKSV